MLLDPFAPRMLPLLVSRRGSRLVSWDEAFWLISRSPRLHADEQQQLSRLRRGKLGRIVHHAIQDDASVLYGTTVTWSDTTGTKAITLNNLAAAALRQGVKSATLIIAPSGLSTAVLPTSLEIDFVVQYTSAPAAGGETSMYAGFSSSSVAGTANPAGLSGTDATGPNVDTLGQLTLCGSVVASNNIGGSANQRARFTVRPLDQYFSPVVYNNASVGLKASNDVSVISVTPAYLVRST